MSKRYCFRHPLTSTIIVLLLVLMDLKSYFGACFPLTSTTGSNNDDYEIIISEPNMSWSGFRLNLDYIFSVPIVGEEIEYAIYSDRECKEGIVSEDEIDSTLIEISGNSLQLSLLFNPKKVHSARYVSYEDDFAVVEVCARFSISQPKTVPAPASSLRDDYIILKVDLHGMNGIVAILDDKSKDWGVDVFRCNSGNQKLLEPAPAVKNGEVLRLCLKSTTKTNDDGIFLAIINSFSFKRNDVIQNAVEHERTDEVTEVICKRGSTLCVIETVLSNNFFHSEGEVKAEGDVYLQFGRQGKEVNRMLRRSIRIDLDSSINTRSLYVYRVGELVGHKPAVHVVSIEPNDELYSAEAFRCDANNDPISEEEALRKEGELKICIEPDKRAIRAGVRIDSLSAFSYGVERNGKTQLAIDSFGHVAKDGSTQLECRNFGRICFIKSTLEDRFFSVNAKIIITGDVILKFGAHNDRQLRAHLIDRNLEESDDGWRHENLGFAGSSEVNAFFNVVKSENVDEKQLSDTQIKLIYAAAASAVVLVWFCCSAYYYFSCRKNQGRGDFRGNGRRMMNNAIKGRSMSRSISNANYSSDKKRLRLISQERVHGRNDVENRKTGKSKRKNRASKRNLNSLGKDTSTAKCVSNEKNSSDKKNSSMKTNRKKTNPGRGQDTAYHCVKGNRNSRSYVSTKHGDLLNINPQEKDVCFKAKYHPGTQAFLKAVKKTIEELGPTSYSPNVYKNIRRQLSGRKFFVKVEENVDDDESDVSVARKGNKWREVEKRELIQIIWKFHEEAKIANAIRRCK